MKHVTIKFVEDRAEVEYNIDNTAQLFTALLSIEGIIGRITGLGATEIREIVDDEKQHIEVKAKPEEVIDTEEVED